MTVISSMRTAQGFRGRHHISQFGLLLLLGSLLIGRVDSAAGEVLLVHSLHAHDPESVLGRTSSATNPSASA